MRRLYTVDQIQAIMHESVSASVPAWRRWRASRILSKLPDAVLNQAGIVARNRLDRALSDLLGYEVRAGDPEPVAEHQPRHG